MAMFDLADKALNVVMVFGDDIVCFKRLLP